MKRLITIVLIAVMLFGLAVPASADEDMKLELTSIAEHVIAILDIEDNYTDFSGEFNDGIPSRWYLNWNRADASVSVSCAEDGTISNFYQGHYIGSYDRFYGFDAAFSPLSSEEARAQAEEWLTKLLAEGETARIDDVFEPKTYGSVYEFSGTILYHGLDTPMNFSLSIGTDGLSNYYRSNCLGDYMGETPSETASVTPENAAAALYGTIGMELYYVSEEGEARLRYVPVSRDYIVDALTGETVDMTALYESFGRNNSNMEAGFGGIYDEETAAAAYDKSTGRSLTEVELSSIENYTDVLPKEELDSTVRSLEALGLSAFSLDRCSYNMDGDENISATLRYSCAITEDNLFGFSPETYLDSAGWGNQPMATKYIIVDARTGELQEVSTSYSLWESGRNNTSDPQVAAQFLKSAAPAMVEESAYCTLSGFDQKTGSTFCRVHDGYFFPENLLYVEINPATGAVDRYTYVWDKNIVFAPSDNLITEEDAKKAYADALTVTLGLVAWPEAINYDDPVLYKYISWGYTYVESLKLAYIYRGKLLIGGIDAITGEPVLSPESQVIFYDDVEGLEQEEMILRLAHAGIGFNGGSFNPDKALTMRDAIILLINSAGYFSSVTEDDELKVQAINQGFITSQEWAPDQEITHRQFVHMIIGASRYGYTAALTDLWPEDGYLQIADALHMLTDRTSAPDEICTRADAAELLYGFMNRAQ